MDKRLTPLEISKTDFQTIGYQLVDTIAQFFDTIKDKPVTPGESVSEVQSLVGTASLPQHGTAAGDILVRAADLLLNHSLLNGHPKFLGYITSSPAPIGALADLLASAVNPNVGARILSPVATEIEKQTVKWLAEFIGLASGYGGLLVSGGNMANFTAFLAARTSKATSAIKDDGLYSSPKLIVYCSKTTHTWIDKAATLFGHGAKSIRWITTDPDNKMDNEVLVATIKDDLKAGNQPFMVVGTAGDVSTGVTDDLAGIASICKTFNLWFHIDGAYGMPAAVVPEFKEIFRGMDEADSIALDPHKWLYSPLEAGCTLVKDPQHLIDAYSAHPAYYNFDNDDESLPQNFYEYGLQNSRGFRALKVWTTLQQVGRNGYVRMISDDIALSRLFFKLAKEHPELEPITQNLSITTLRYVPVDLTLELANKEKYLNALNETLLNKLQQGGEVFLSNAIVDEKYCLRGCIVNFRTSAKDVEEIVEIIVKHGRLIDQQMKKN